MKPQLRVIRRRVRGAMTADCRIVVPGEPVYDRATGQYIPSETVVYAGSCWMRPSNRAERTTSAGGQQLGVTDVEVWIPHTVTVPDSGARLTFTASTGDLSLVGVKMTVAVVTVDDWQLARRLVCQRMTTQ